MPRAIDLPPDSLRGSSRTSRGRSDTVRDRSILYAAAFVRALATGMVGVLIGIYLAKRGFDPAETGTVVGAGPVGDRSGREKQTNQTK